MCCCSEHHVLLSRRDAQAAELQARLQEELLAQKAGLEAQQAALQAQLDKEREVVRGLESTVKGRGAHRQGQQACCHQKAA
jgi:hypothetical protein